MTPWLPGFEDFRIDRTLRIYVAAVSKRVEGVYRKSCNVEVAYAIPCHDARCWRFYVDWDLKVSADTIEELIPAVDAFLTKDAEERRSAVV